jgi:p-aminobenzoyl-glutamate transporter AbgT
MLPYSVILLLALSLLLIGFWILGIPLGLGASYR